MGPIIAVAVSASKDMAPKQISTIEYTKSYNAKSLLQSIEQNIDSTRPRPLAPMVHRRGKSPSHSIKRL